MTGSVIAAVGGLVAIACALSLLSYFKRVLDAEDEREKELTRAPRAKVRARELETGGLRR